MSVPPYAVRSQSFVVLDDVKDYYSKHGSLGSAAEQTWDLMFQKYQSAHGDLAKEFVRRMSGELPSDWKKCLPSYSHLDAKAVATRNR